MGFLYKTRILAKQGYSSRINYLGKNSYLSPIVLGCPFHIEKPYLF